MRTTWTPGNTPITPKGTASPYWVTVKDSNGNLSVKPLIYMHGFIAPLHADLEPTDAPACAEPVDIEMGEYAWTGWFTDHCQYCDVFSEYVGHEIIAYAQAPPAYAEAHFVTGYESHEGDHER